MWDVLFYLIVVIALAAGIVGAGLFARSYMTGGSASQLFTQRAERRLDVMEQANVDGRRKLLLIRRDDVEHLIMTGGPVDVVIETGIGQQGPRAAPAGEAAGSAQAIFTRAPRSFGQAAASGEPS